jgi:alanyl-tRNA synthetase
VEPTLVTFPAGATSGTGTVLDVRPVPDGFAVVVDRTPFHPLDHAWPDQPADTGTLDGRPVLDCRTGAHGPDGTLALGADIAARRGEAGWTWVVAHIVEQPPDVGAQVQLEVEPDRRAALSRAHTACHLAALAINAEAAPWWREGHGARSDSLGSPDLDAMAIERSRIEPDRSIDEYRLGKSIRKKGLDSAALLAGLDDLAVRATQRLQSWIATGAPVAIDAGDGTLTARRTWRCALPGGDATYPCGGTHVTTLADVPATTSLRITATAAGYTVETVVG